MSFLDRSFELHFNERPFLNHFSYLFITKTTKERSRSQSNFSILCRGNIIPKEVRDKETVSLFLESVDQFERILNDSAFIRLERLTTDEIVGTPQQAGLIEKYFSLSQQDTTTLKDIQMSASEMRIGDDILCVHTLSDVDDLPGSVQTDTRYEKYSTDRSDCRLSFAAPVGLMLSCNHIYNQFLFIDDSAEILQRFEKTARNMHSLSKYSRANQLNKQWIDAYLDEAHSFGLTAIRCHCNVMAWSDSREKLKVIKNDTGSALALRGCGTFQAGKARLDTATTWADDRLVVVPRRCGFPAWHGDRREVVGHISIRCVLRDLGAVGCVGAPADRLSCMVHDRFGEGWARGGLLHGADLRAYLFGRMAQLVPACRLVYARLGRESSRRGRDLAAGIVAFLCGLPCADVAIPHHARRAARLQGEPAYLAVAGKADQFLLGEAVRASGTVFVGAGFAMRGSDHVARQSADLVGGLTVHGDGDHHRHRRSDARAYSWRHHPRRWWLLANLGGFGRLFGRLAAVGAVSESYDVHVLFDCDSAVDRACDLLRA